MNLDDIVKEEFDNFKQGELLNELKLTSYKYGCVMLYFNITKTWWDSVQKVIENKDVARINGVLGREKYRDVHVTLLYGLHKKVTLDDIKEEIDDLPVRNVITNKVSYFEGSDNDVLKFEMNYEFFKKFNKALRKLDHTNTFPNYIPHMTIAYVKKGKGKYYADLLNNKFKRTHRPTHFVFSKSDGSKENFDFNKKI